MRISNKKDFEALVAKGLIPKAIQDDALGAFKRSSRRKNGRRKLLNHNACSIIPTMPADILYHHLVRIYGRHVSGGLMVMELTFTPLGRRWRLDMAMPSLKLGIELDGWKSHGLYRDSFLRDREKSLWFERRGWRVVRFSANQIREELNDVLLAIVQIMAHCKHNDDVNWTVRQTDFDRSEYDHEQR